MNGQPRNTRADDDFYDGELASIYRQAGAEEPPLQLDASIRAAARREADAAPRTREREDIARGASGSSKSMPWRSWRVPVALAAVVVLTVSLATIITDNDIPSMSAVAPDASRTAHETPQAPERRALSSERQAAPEKPQSALRDAPARQREALRADAAREAPASPAAAAEAAGQEPPERWGKKILDLRRQGRFAEAEELMALFKRRFPNYPIPDEWTRK